MSGLGVQCVGLRVRGFKGLGLRLGDYYQAQ